LNHHAITLLLLLWIGRCRFVKERAQSLLAASHEHSAQPLAMSGILASTRQTVVTLEQERPKRTVHRRLTALKGRRPDWSDAVGKQVYQGKSTRGIMHRRRVPVDPAGRGIDAPRARRIRCHHVARGTRDGGIS
jgi:hypothetical protein